MRRTWPFEAMTPGRAGRGCWALAACLSGLTAPSVAASLGGPTTQVGALPAIVGVRTGGNIEHARLVVEFDRPFTAPLLVAEANARETLVFDGAVGDLTREGEGFGPVRRWWLATADGNRASLIIGLASGAHVLRRFSLSPAREGGAWRYVVDVGAESAAPGPPALAPVVEATTSPSPSPAPVSRRRRHSLLAIAEAAPPPERRKVVVIDPGHGGMDPGARGVGVDEKEVNLAEALALRDRLRREDRYEVVLTRDRDVFVALDERVRIARRAGADLFISLHSDSAGSDAAPHGASVYTLSDHGVSRVNEVIGPDEWMSRRAAPGVGPILLDLTQRDTLNRSASFAGLLIDRIGRDVDLLPRTHRDAGYFVLLAPDVPAVLLEMGFITSPLDQARLTDPGSRARLAEAIAEAVDVYFAGGAPEPSGSWRVSSATRPR